MMPKWSPQGDRVAFVRRPGGSGSPKPLLQQQSAPWEIWVAELATATGSRWWMSPETLRGSYPTTHGGANLNWTGMGELVFLSYEDGWPHLYHLSPLGSKQLTKGNFMVEHVSMDKDASTVLFSANYGQDPEDKDRRHLGMLDLVTGNLRWLTSGTGIETFPVLLSEKKYVAYLGSNAKQPLLPAVLGLPDGEERVIGKPLLPDDFPVEELAVPKQVTFRASDGVLVHGQLFETDDAVQNKPAVVFVHGGPQRQMLLGWHYGDYYANTYALNQFLAAKGFVVLSVNFRLGIGYGFDFHKPSSTYWQGATEYRDIKAAGNYLTTLPQVDDTRIGIYGGSYGGYLTALALARDSGLFKAGVDIHGVHELSSRLELPEGYEKAPDFEIALQTAWESSPLANLDTWTSPVLFIHGDNDRNVQVVQTVDIVRRFQELGKPFDYLLIPDDTHHWMKFGNQLKVGEATVDFLQKHLSER
jgi:dipeptidyl aminopeptidase/acylaminoacyl peptidase